MQVGLIWIYFGVLLVGITLLIPMAVKSSRMLKAIEIRYPEVWRRLGRPRFGFMHIEQHRKLQAFFRKKEHRELNDPEIEAIASAMARLEKGVQACFWLAIVLFLIGVSRDIRW